jgi:photosystem II stability/assembly factor-like uncharacterized protein
VSAWGDAEGTFEPNAPADAIITTDGGQTWTNVGSEFPAASDTLRSISCPTSQICYSVGYPGYTGAFSGNAGQSWTSIAGPTNVTPPVPGEQGRTSAGGFPALPPHVRLGRFQQHRAGGGVHIE